MKGGFTIRNENFFRALQVLSQELYEQGIPYAVVGGTAVQVRLANLVSKNGEENFNRCPSMDILLRKTGDIDLATDSTLEDMVTFFNMLQAQTPDVSVRSSVEYHAGMCVGGESVAVNYQVSPEQFKGLTTHYKEIINTAVPRTIRRGRNQATVYVPSDNYLLASKIIRGKEKDKIDAVNLIKAIKSAGKEPPLEQARSILKSVGRENKFDKFADGLYDLI